MRVTNSVEIHLARFNSLTDLHFLTKHILGYNDITDSFHKPLCGMVQSVNPVIVRMAQNDSPLTEYLKLYAETSYLTKDRKSYKKIDSTTLHNHHKIVSYLESIGYGFALGSYNTYYRTYGDDKSIKKDFRKPDRGGGAGGSLRQTPTQNFIENFQVPISEMRMKSGVEGSGIERWVEWDERARERLWMVFRGSFKTTVITIAHTIQLMLLWPNIRILIASHKKEGGSQEILHAIKRHFIANETLRALFPEYCPTANAAGQVEWGTTEKVTLPNRSPSCAWPESTIEIAGLTTDVTGRHYDYIKNDDLVTRDSVTNETMIQKTRQFKALQKFLFNQPEWGLMDNVGTFYHFNDIYNTLRKSKRVSKIVVPIVENDQVDVENWVPTVPERFTAVGCKQLKDDPTMTLIDWNNQYMLNPIPPEDQTFRPEWFERLGFYYQPEEVANRRMRVSVYVDPANKRNKKSDYTAIMVLGVDEKGQKFVLDVIRDKLGVEERTNLAISLVKKYGEKRMFYETIGFQDTDKYIIEKKCRETGYFIQVIEIKGQSSSKEDRIKGLQPLYERGDIRWPEHYWYYSKYDKAKYDMVELLKDEFLMFPRCEHDDMIDCHSLMLRNAELRPSKAIQKTDDDMFEKLRDITIKSKQPPKFHGFGKKGQRPYHGIIPAKRSLW